jgi:hypothetical protein
LPGLLQHDFLSDIALNTDNRGFAINGEAAGDRPGRSVSNAGDVNGDGLDDLIIILVRKLLRRGTFTSTNELKTRILDFIDYFNRTMAKPFKWTYKGKVLAV